MTARVLGPTRIGGLPAHVLLVHAVVVLVPLAALCLVASAWWPAARRRLGLATPALGAVSVVCVPLTVDAGEWLARNLRVSGPLLQRHERLGHGLVPWTAGLFVLSVVVWSHGRWRSHRTVTTTVEASASGTDTRGGTAVLARPAPARRATGRSVAVTVAIAVLATVVAVGTVAEVYRIGDSGARAVWSGTVR